MSKPTHHVAARLPLIDTRRCTGCGRCVAACSLHLLSLEVVRWQKFSVLHEAHRCTACRDCATICPFHAITMRGPARIDTGDAAVRRSTRHD